MHLLIHPFIPTFLDSVLTDGQSMDERLAYRIAGEAVAARWPDAAAVVLFCWYHDEEHGVLLNGEWMDASDADKYIDAVLSALDADRRWIRD